MTPSLGSVVRLTGLVVLVVVLQISGVADIRVAGGNPDLVPLLVAGVGLYAGSASGAATGFGAGLLLDLAFGQNLGASSLVLTVVGYSVGRYSELRDPAHGLLPVPVAGLATLGYAAAFAVVSFLLEIEAEVSALVFREMLATAVLNALIALPAFALIRRILRPVLAFDPADLRRRRLPPRETGPLGLRGLEV